MLVKMTLAWQLLLFDKKVSNSYNIQKYLKQE